jgi:hypothetical protein
MTGDRVATIEGGHTHGLSPPDNRIDDLVAWDAYIAYGHADVVDENGNPR